MSCAITLTWFGVHWKLKINYTLWSDYHGTIYSRLKIKMKNLGEDNAELNEIYIFGQYAYLFY